MHQFRLAVATRCFRRSLMDSLLAAASVGVEGVQFDLRTEVIATELTDTGRRQFLHRVGELNLTVSGATYALARPLTEEHDIDRRVNELRDALRFAYLIKATTLCCKVGRIPADVESTSRKLLVEVLNDLARHSNHVGAVLCITPTDDSPEEMLKLIDEIKAGPIGVDFDPAQFALSGYSTTEAVRTLHSVTRHFQLRDGFRGFDGGGQETVMGNGVIDWIELLVQLAETEYQGWLTAIRNQGDDRATDVARAIKHVRGLLVGM